MKFKSTFSNHLLVLLIMLIIPAIAWTDNKASVTHNRYEHLARISKAQLNSVLNEELAKFSAAMWPGFQVPTFTSATHDVDIYRVNMRCLPMHLLMTKINMTAPMKPV